MKKTKPLEIYAVFALVQSIVVRALMLAILIYSAMSFKQNPVFISIVIIFSLLLLLATGIDVIRIYPDRFEHVSTAMLPVFCKRKTFYYKNIRHVKAEGPATFIEQLLTGKLKWNHVHITKTNEEVITICSYLYMDHLMKAVKLINERIKS